MYHEYFVHLSDGQKRSIVTAYKNKTSVTLRFSADQLTGKDKVMLTETQLKKINLAKATHTGVEITFSKTQMTKQKGGILPLLAAAIPALIALGKAAAIGAATAAGGVAVKKIVDAAEGKGLHIDNYSQYRRVPRGGALFKFFFI